jgi:hypothetical protein
MFSLGQAFSDMETSPVNYWEDFGRFFYPNARNYRNFSKPGGEQEQLYQQYRDAILGSQGQANENARIGQDYLRGLLQNQPDQFQRYSQIGDYLYGKLDSFSNSLKDSGLRDMNSRLAGLGIRPGSTGYDRLLNATRITNNLAPAFANTTNAIGNDYARLAGQDFNNTLLRTNLVQGDALNRAMDQAFARPLTVADVRFNQLSNNNRLFTDMVNAMRANTAGFETKETSDWAKGIGVVDNLLNGIVDLYMSAYGGGMMGGGQVGSGANANPYSNTMLNTGSGVGAGQSGGAGGFSGWLQGIMGNNTATGTTPAQTQNWDWNNFGV